MNSLYKLFYKQNETFEVGDIILYCYHNTPVKVTHVSNTSLNNMYRKDYCAKLPFWYSYMTTLSDEAADMILKQFEQADASIQKNSKDDVEFMTIFKSTDTALFKFYKKIKNVEFIPKNINHLNILYNAIYK